MNKTAAANETTTAVAIDAVAVKYASTVFANRENAYLKKAYRRSKKYREAVFIKHTIYSNVYDFMAFGYDMAEIKKICREEGLSLSAVKRGLRYYGSEVFYYMDEEYMLPPIPATREVIKHI